MPANVCSLEYSYHNLQPPGIGRLQGKLQDDLDLARRHPSSYVVIVSGNFNFLSPGEFRHSLSTPNSTRPAECSNQPHQPENTLQHLLLQLVDVAGTLDTRYDSANKMVSRLDRIYISVPTWLLTQFHVQSSTCSDPLTLHQRKISDHIPVVASFAAKRKTAHMERPIPPYVFDSPLYTKAVNALVQASNLDQLSVPLRLPKFKSIIREAARIARNDLLVNAQSHTEAEATIFGTIARCVWTNDSKLFDKLTMTSPIVSRYLVRTATPSASWTTQNLMRIIIGSVQKSFTSSFGPLMALELKRGERVRERLLFVEWPGFGTRLGRGYLLLAFDCHLGVLPTSLA